jgi:hypothetical protein
MTAINHHLTATEFSKLLDPKSGASLINELIQRRALNYYAAINATGDMKGVPLYVTE